jgi:hypothetical protein
VLDILLRAHDNFKENNEDLSKCKPYFLILDEMNLSHVERYFADFLSAMESGDEIKLYTGEDRSWEVDETKNKEGDFNEEFKVEPKLKMPKNLFIIGTVNIDETTYMFSPKVLDRANTIEFRITKGEMETFFEDHQSLDMNQLLEDVANNVGKGAKKATEFMQLAKGEGVSFERQKHQKTFVEFFRQLQPAGAEFGYRTANEMTELIGYLNHFSVNSNDAYDIAIMQKLLPKLHGSRKKLVGPLETLAGFCVVRLEGSKQDEQHKSKSNYQQFIAEKRNTSHWKIKYPISLEKIERMHKNVIENGFTSYAEA